jgi:copper resistance protein B
MRLFGKAGAAILATLMGGAVHAAEVDLAAHETPIFHFMRIEADYAASDDSLWSWDFNGWVGGDIDRVWMRSEGTGKHGDLEEAEAQLYYGRNFATFWDALVGIKQDFSPAARTSLAASIVGLAPYFFETEASLFLSTKGEASLRFKQSFDVLITQRLIAEPYVEVNVFAREVPDLNVGAGFSGVEAGLQLRYEIRRQFAPYVDLVWGRKLGETFDLARAAGNDPEETTVRLGIRSWF